MFRNRCSLLLLFCCLCNLWACQSPKNGDNNDDVYTEEDQAQAAKVLRDSLEKIFEKNLDSIGQLKPNTAKDLTTKNDLADFMPDIEGYQKVGKLQTSQSQIQQTVFLQLEQTYQNADNKVTVAIVDYGLGSPAYALATQALTFSYTMKNEEVVQKPYNADDETLVGRISFDKKTKEATALLGVADRFFISVSADKQTDARFVKNVIEEMDIDAMKEF